MSTTNRNIPGTVAVEGREHLYILDDGNDCFKKHGKQSLFGKVTSQCSIAQHGGVISENCKLWLPTEELFHGLSYKGDIKGWRTQIQQGAALLGLLTGRIEADNIILSDGRTYPLSACKTVFY
ncbi:hypothetical protein [Chitinophaga qingshengii]|uniref:Uncharacterized protein n=1 Tax=Chitinophaga qingshengii TaxID=1569794 RepID=A0ABR7TMI6_9BACT|nr:hypothetical protein [Chitinophaga qingshengii]MBC9931203.1 hypothetical protein [Chitinophaga qingshengii]